jgi:hypothetical protein
VRYCWIRPHTTVERYYMHSASIFRTLYLPVYSLVLMSRSEHSLIG